MSWQDSALIAWIVRWAGIVAERAAVTRGTAVWPSARAVAHVRAACRMFETFSFLPPLSDREIASQVDYIIANGWTPCLEFADTDCAYVQDKSQARFGNSASAVRRASRAFRVIVAVSAAVACRSRTDQGAEPRWLWGTNHRRAIVQGLLSMRMLSKTSARLLVRGVTMSYLSPQRVDKHPVDA